MIKNNSVKEDMAYYFKYNKETVLSKDEERQLMVLASKGDKQAKDKLVLGNMRFAFYMAKKYEKCGMEFIDLVEECICGLVQASNSIKPEYNNRFTTYARYWIMNAVNKAINASGNSMRLSENSFRMMKKVRFLYNKLRNTPNGNEESCNRIIAEKLGITEEKVYDLLFVSQDTRSLESFLSAEDGEAVSYEKILKDEVNQGPEDTVIENLLKEDIAKAMSELPEHEAEVLNLHYGLDGYEPMSFSKVADICGYTKSWANFAEKRAKKYIKRIYPDLEMYIA